MTGIIPHSTIVESVGIYREQTERIRRLFSEISDAETTLKNALGSHIYVDWRRIHLNDPDYSLKCIEKQAWSAIIEKLGVRRFASVKRWDELQRAINDGTLPELTIENVGGLMSGFHRQADEMWLESVKEVFDFLRPWRSMHKTNSPDEIGPKAIVEHAVEVSLSVPHIVYWKAQTFAALENVLNGIAGRGTVNKDGYSELATMLRLATDGKGETSLFKFRWFKNGNLHLEFKDYELICQLNALAGGKNLKKGKAQKP